MRVEKQKFSSIAVEYRDNFRRMTAIDNGKYSVSGKIGQNSEKKR